MSHNLTEYRERLSQSFVALGDFFVQRPKAVRQVLAFLLVIHTALIGYSAAVHSPVWDEPAYLAAGISHWKSGTFDLYRVNPPLVRMVAALPVAAFGKADKWNGHYDKVATRQEFAVGADFVRVNGERSKWLVTVARWACIPFSWLGAYICFRWSHELYGPNAGICACALWCLSPNILAHGSLISTDLAAASLGAAASYLFWRWLKLPTWNRALRMGAVLGVAQLSKTTLILLYPLWPLLWCIYRASSPSKQTIHAWLMQASMLIMAEAVSIYILNAGYAFEGSMLPLRSYNFASQLLTSSSCRTDSVPEGGIKKTEAFRTNRFLTSFLGKLPVPLPKDYLIGIDLQQRDFEGGTFASYLGGQFSDHGWWYFYLYSIALKEPIGTLMLGCAVILYWLRGARRTAGWHDELALLFPTLFVLAVASSKSGFSHHMHYILFCFPFIYIWIGQVVSAKPVSSTVVPSLLWRRCDTRHSLLAVIVIPVLLMWSILSSLWSYPHSLSYFNEFVGGPNGGSAHLLYSNIDWGQDLYYLRRWIERHTEAKNQRPFYLAYLGSFSPTDMGLHQARSWPLDDPKSGTTASSKSLSSDLAPGYYAISVNLLMGVTLPPRGGDNLDGLVSGAAIDQMRKKLSCDRVGYTIVIYDVNSNQH